MLKKCLKIFTIILLIGFIGVFVRGYIYQDSKSKTEDKSLISDTSQKQTIIDEESIDSILKNETDDKKTSNDTITENNQEQSSSQKNNNQNKNNNTATKKDNNSNSKTTSSNDQNTTPQSAPAPSVAETPKVETPKSCTPKKFDMSFVRADFSSHAECDSVGTKYKNAGYGYFCDYYQDDCGDTYYMLTIYERNTGKEFDYHTIQIPNE